MVNLPNDSTISNVATKGWDQDQPKMVQAGAPGRERVNLGEQKSPISRTGLCW